MELAEEDNLDWLVVARMKVAAKVLTEQERHTEDIAYLVGSILVTEELAWQRSHTVDCCCIAHIPKPSSVE